MVEPLSAILGGITQNNDDKYNFNVQFNTPNEARVFKLLMEKILREHHYDIIIKDAYYDNKKYSGNISL